MMSESSEISPVKSRIVNTTFNQHGRKISSLHLATMLGISGCVDVLLNDGVDPNLQDSFGNTALHLAVKRKNVQILQAFLNNHINLDTKNKKGYTALHLAVMEGSFDAVRALLNSNADTNTKDLEGRTPLHDAISKRNLNIIWALLGHNADVNARDSVANTPLHYAARLDGQDLVQALVKKNAMVNVQNYRGQTPLHYAASEGGTGVVKTLIDNDADINIRDSKGQTALYLSNSNTRDFLTFHMKKLHILKLYICQENLNLLSDWEENLDMEVVDDFESSRDKELVEMKSQIIDHCSISFYKFMVIDVHTRANLLNNQKIIDFLRFIEWERKFPMYGHLLKVRFIEALRRNELLKNIHSLYTSIFQYLAHNCIDHVYSYLSNDELQTLIGIIELESTSDNL